MTSAPGWHEANQRYLGAALERLRGGLERHIALTGSIAAAPSEGHTDHLARAAAQLPHPAALDRVCEVFGLSRFERDVLLLTAGMELDAGFASLCASAQADPQRAHPTFSLALAALPEAHWSALSPGAPLRYWRLIEVGSGSLTRSALRIDERILHYLTGVQHLDEHLAGFVWPLRTDPGALAPSHRAVAERIAAAWSSRAALPLVQLVGPDGAAKQAIAAAACASLGLALYRMPADVLPAAPHEFDVLVRLWAREAALSASALLLDADDTDASDQARERLIARFMEAASGALLASGRERRRLKQRALVTLEVNRPNRLEQSGLWQQRLGDDAGALNGHIERLTTQFDLSANAIEAACLHTRAHRAEPRRTAAVLAEDLWEACRVQARPKLDDLATRIPSAAAWQDLVLPEPQRQTLRDIATHVRQRTRVYDTWGFGGGSARGLGISALFHGPSGTGKTMAAEVLAAELRLDLYRIDLSQVVSKYIGETEKNLGRVFDSAEEGGAVLLFDEADALFGRRTEVKDSHDRFANIEVSYLLQRMEAYRGLAILTTNMKGALDDAFLRRIRFVVAFPFPDAAQRAEIWRRAFPAETPTEALDIQKLARLNVPGGNIRNIALNAAFLAADDGGRVRMADVLRAARSEYAKLEKPLTDLEIRGWIPDQARGPAGEARAARPA